MNIDSINSTSQVTKTYKNPDDNSKISFSDKLKEAVNDSDDKGYTALLNEINNEPEDDRVEDMKLYNVLKGHEFNCKGHNLQWAKEHCGLIGFPLITAPGHIRKAFSDYLESLPISEHEKGNLSFALSTAYGEYKKRHPKDTISFSYSTDSMKDLINYLLNYNENYKDSKDIPSMHIYEDTKSLLKELMNSL